MRLGASWRPAADWERLAGAEGAATEGVWLAAADERRWIVKRIRPDFSVTDRHSYRWWRREVEVAGSGITSSFRGLVAPEYRVEQDNDEVTLWSAEIVGSDIPPKVAARALGEFASSQLDDPGWFSANRLRDRVSQANPAGLAALDSSSFDKSTLALMGAVWDRRAMILDKLDSLPHVLSHGDALPRNLLRHDGTTVTAIDWDQLGYAPIGADLATYSMWTTTPIEVLINSYIDGLTNDLAPAVVRTGVALTTALIAVSRVIRNASTNQAHSYQERLRRAVPQLAAAVDHTDIR